MTNPSDDLLYSNNTADREAYRFGSHAAVERSKARGRIKQINRRLAGTSLDFRGECLTDELRAELLSQRRDWEDHLAALSPVPMQQAAE